MGSSKRPRLGYDKPIVDVWRREVGVISSRSFAHRVAASEDLVLRFDLARKLEKHRGCVNTLSFNSSGDILISGSDDRKVILWDWESGKVKLLCPSGHNGNVFQAKFMPDSNDCTVVTCAADGQVRLMELQNSGRVETSFLGSHEGRVHKLGIQPGSAHVFLTCGEDGAVQHFDLRTKTSTVLLTCRSGHDRRRYRPIIRLNAIAFDPRNPDLFSVGGTDEYARVYDVRKYKWDGSNDFDHPVNYFCPSHMIGDERVGITGLAFSELSELLVSYNFENIYLFGKDMGLGSNPEPSSPGSTCSSGSSGEAPPESSDETSQTMINSNEMPTPQVYKGHRNCDTVKGVNFFGPRCEYVVSGSDCGRIFIWRRKDGELIRVMEADKHVVNCIVPNPHTTMLASSGIENDIKIWIPQAEEKATLPTNIGEFESTSGDWMYHLQSPEEMLLQLFSRQNESTGSGDVSESRALLEMILSFSRQGNPDDSSDEEGDGDGDGDEDENGDGDDDDDNSGPEDFFS